MSGFTIPAQNFAATHRIPLIEFNKMPFWDEFHQAVRESQRYDAEFHQLDNGYADEHITNIINRIAEKSAVAVTNSGQMLFLYHVSNGDIEFDDFYSLSWREPYAPWILQSGERKYQFQLPDEILKLWLQNSSTTLDMKVNAINCKVNHLSHMVVYYTQNSMPQMKMISIERYHLEEALRQLI